MLVIPRLSQHEKMLRAAVQASIEAHGRLERESLTTLLSMAELFVAALRANKKLMFCGNGGSAADAQHVAAELVGRFARQSKPYAALALSTDTSILTAVANDYSYDEVFSRQVLALCQPGDVVIGISTSGNSKNVVRALEAARERGATRVGVTGESGGLMQQHTDLLFCAPSSDTARIQELHLLAWHAVVEVVERVLHESEGKPQTEAEAQCTLPQLATTGS